MNTKCVISLIITFTVFPVSAEELNSKINSLLHKASNNFGKSVDFGSVVNSLYEQIRPRAKITKENLSSNEIDTKVKKYVKEKYAPALIGNYSQLYSKLKSAKKDFSSCKTLEPIEPGKDVLASLCTKKIDKSIHVLYMTNGFGQGWSKSVEFIFRKSNKDLLLSAIELQLKEGVKAHVDGI